MEKIYKCFGIVKRSNSVYTITDIADNDIEKNKLNVIINAHSISNNKK